VEATLGNKKDQISIGKPVMQPHNFRNAGSNTAKMIRFFSSPNTVKRRFFFLYTTYAINVPSKIIPSINN
jgi:hypothetical protein